MTDIATTFDQEILTGDLAVTDGQLAGDDGLETAVLHSLFSDRRARLDDPLPFPNQGRRGWWGDLTLANSGDQYGSRLWLLEREKQTPQVLNRAREYAAESLAWLLEDGEATAVNIEAEWVRRGVLGLSITITLRAGGEFYRQYQLALGG